MLMGDEATGGAGSRDAYPGGWGRVQVPATIKFVSISLLQRMLPLITVSCCLHGDRFFPHLEVQELKLFTDQMNLKLTQQLPSGQEAGDRAT